MIEHDEQDAGDGERHATELMALLRTARARTRIARLARVLSIALPAAGAGGALAGWAGMAGPWQLAAAAAVVPIAAALAAWRTPGIAAVAAALDTRLSLADRTSTAVRVMPRRDALAAAIVKDAAAKLTAGSVVAAIRYDAHPRAGSMWLVALACALLWFAGPGPGEYARSGQFTSGRTVEGRSAAAPEADSTGRGATPTATPAITAEERETTRRPQAAARERSADTPAGFDERRSHAPDSAAAPTADRPDSTGRRGASGRAGGDAAVPAQEPNGPGPREATASPSGRAGTSAATAARGGTAPAATPVGAGAGGVQRGSLAPAAEPGPVPTAAPRLSAAALASARAGAEAAIAHDDVPPRRRAYLRDYYRAVGALSQP